MLPKKQTEVVACTTHVCLGASTGSSGLLPAGVQFSYHFVVSHKTWNVQTYVQWNVCHNHRKTSCGGTAAFCRHDRWEQQGTLECVHTVEAHTENRARGLLSLSVTSIAVANCPAIARLQKYVLSCMHLPAVVFFSHWYFFPCTLPDGIWWFTITPPFSEGRFWATKNERREEILS